MKKSKQPKTHFVPRVVFEAAFVGVVPICVAATACGDNSGNGADASGDAKPDMLVLTVANIGFDSSTARDASNRDAPIFSVAFIGFDGGVGDNAFSVPEASDAADAHDATHPDAPIFSVAFIGFDGGDAHDADATLAVADAAFRPPDGSAG